MKRAGDLWDRVVAWDNLLLAARKARRGKRDRPGVRLFEFDREWQLLRIQAELCQGTYIPGPFRTHWIDRPKPRLISAAPYRDRVVHHALLNVLEPLFERRFHFDSYACRKGKGTHAAARRAQEMLRRHRYAVHCDIRKFFPSIDHEVLKRIYRRIVKDHRLLAIMDLIVDSSNPQEDVPAWFPNDELFTPFERRHGLPIGNLTSQWLANLYLNDLDHLATAHLRLGGIVRYCDDFILFDSNHNRLRQALRAVADFLAARRLRLHEERCVIRPARLGVTFVGYRIWPSHFYLRKASIRRFRRRLRWMKRAYAARQISSREIVPRLMSWLGHVGQADSEGLIRRLGREWVFRRKEYSLPCKPGR